jgi:hypothetical protein
LPTTPAPSSTPTASDKPKLPLRMCKGRVVQHPAERELGAGVCLRKRLSCPPFCRGS